MSDLPVFILIHKISDSCSSVLCPVPLWGKSELCKCFAPSRGQPITPGQTVKDYVVISSALFHSSVYNLHH